MLIDEIAPPKSYAHFTVVKAYRGEFEGQDDMRALCSWLNDNMPRITPRNPTWTMISTPHTRGAYSLKFYFSTEELAARLLTYPAIKKAA